jgi:hypothetical protein
MVRVGAELGRGLNGANQGAFKVAKISAVFGINHFMT